jgi:hypothetical protein
MRSAWAKRDEHDDVFDAGVYITEPSTLYPMFIKRIFPSEVPAAGDSGKIP